LSMRRLKAGCDMNKLSAAALKLDFSATAMNAWSSPTSVLMRMKHQYIK